MKSYTVCGSLLLFLYTVLGLLASEQALGQGRIELIDSSQAGCSFRGLSVVDDQVVWVSGSKGTVGQSADGGKTWRWMVIPGFEKSDFRDIEAFDDKRAVIMASGTPAVILRTTDGGQNWKLVFRDDRPEMFLDAMDFWDESRGLVVGDPVNGHFVLLKTTNGGRSWMLLDSARSPMALDSEAVFAASGTSLRCWGKNEFGFVTGGKYTRFIFGKSRDRNLRNHVLPIISGKAFQGTFAFSVKDNFFVAVGGDYTNDSSVAVNSASTQKFNKRVFSPHDTSQDVKGYRSGIEILKLAPYTQIIACGTSGVDLTSSSANCIYAKKPGIYQWENISKQGFNVVRKAKKGRAVFLAGSKGRIGKLIY